MTSSTHRDLMPLFLVLLVEGLLFIPVMRLLDDMIPGTHAGFGLIGIWLSWVVPGVILFGVVTYLLHRRVVERPAGSRSSFRRIAWLCNVVFVAVSVARYRLKF